MAKLGNPINIAAAGEAGRASLIAGANEDVIDLLPVLRAIRGRPHDCRGALRRSQCRFATLIFGIGSVRKTFASIIGVLGAAGAQSRARDRERVRQQIIARWGCECLRQNSPLERYCRP